MSKASQIYEERIKELESKIKNWDGDYSTKDIMQKTLTLNYTLLTTKTKKTYAKRSYQ